MTLQQLRYIVAIDQYRHFGKAAEACGLTQSTLSLMIKKMEEELDVRIFNREAHPVAPTEIGRKVIDQARIVLYNVEQISEITRKEKETMTGSLRIALISTVVPVLVPGLFKYIGKHFPAISLHTEEMLTETIKDKLRKAEVDMGIIAGSVRDPGFLDIPLYRERFLAYVSPDNPAYSAENIRTETLLDQPLWIIRDGLRQLDPRDLKGGSEAWPSKRPSPPGWIVSSPSWKKSWLRPITDPTPMRTISLVVRADFIHEAKLNAVVDAVRHIIPGELLETAIRRGHLTL